MNTDNIHKEMKTCNNYTDFNNKAFNKTVVYHDLMCHLSFTNTSQANITELESYEEYIYKLDPENKYSEPMIVIGMYIAVASLYCILAMVVDLLHGLRRKKPWFPCKYFSINAFSLTVIVVAMKLPVDLNGNMPGDVDQATKLGSMAFMCTMMANFLPCLATMGNTELLTNITAFGVLVITLVVNVCIQIHSGVVGIIPNDEYSKDAINKGAVNPGELTVFSYLLYTTVAIIYVAMLLMLLIIYVRSSLAILGSKQIIESKYQKQHKATSKSIDRFAVEKLQQHWSFKAVFGSSVKTTKNSKQHNFVLQLEDENELAERIPKRLSKAFNQLIKKSEKKQPKNLMKLITERSSKDLQGVRKLYDNNYQPDCWSLAVVTLTTIAITLPNIKKGELKRLLESVREGIKYITLIEENLNATKDYERLHKAAKKLWQEAKDKINQELQSADNECQESHSSHIFICANSMSRIAQTIINGNESHEKLFDELSSRIADIMAACLTNLPQVIPMQAHTSVIEKREASVKAAARLLGYAKSVYLLDLENRYNEPMLWIGMYIALASLCCLVAMVADLLHGLRSRRLWFPCKYFTINAASLTVIAVAMKLPCGSNWFDAWCCGPSSKARKHGLYVHHDG
ncbi:uncharacterized protein LOC143632321 [Bidens hawaiensis]|uniref:uncharacterized protein LOC143632321 n=1 Tax=Bidens hawaiensis TaxID=980011 RepID=UPI004049849F